MIKEKEITQATLNYANNQKDIPIKDAFTKYLCIVLGQAFMEGAKWAVQTGSKNMVSEIERRMKNPIEKLLYVDKEEHAYYQGEIDALGRMRDFIYKHDKED